MKIALIGYGKMGRMIEKIALKRGHTIVCKIDVDNQEDFNTEAFASAEGGDDSSLWRLRRRILESRDHGGRGDVSHGLQLQRGTRKC